MKSKFENVQGSQGSLGVHVPDKIWNLGRNNFLRNYTPEGGELRSKFSPENKEEERSIISPEIWQFLGLQISNFGTPRFQ